MIVDLGLPELISDVSELLFVVKGVQSFIGVVHVVSEALGLLNVESVHEPAVISPLAELLGVVVVAFLGDFGGCLGWAACASFISEHFC